LDRASPSAHMQLHINARISRPEIRQLFQKPELSKCRKATDSQRAHLAGAENIPRTQPKDFESFDDPGQIKLPHCGQFHGPLFARKKLIAQMLFE